ncbi:MAG: hypothetical protein ACD_11C00020G0060 [uncultured bacterium]|nr:MAG: hypothetical protein ACD_11C00020G0060 [uncultured bacterium]HBR71347.1 hypothetical protein [Candidatus Moranbacteria bacterium]
MKMAKLLLLLLCVAILSGCATTTGLKNGPEYLGKALDLTVRPEQSLGVRVTPALENGNVTVFELPITDSQFGGEMYPGRIMFPGMVTNEKGEEFFAQSVLAGIYPSGELMSFVIVDGKLSDMRGAKFLAVSSHTDYFWNEKGEAIFFERQKFYEEKKYRDELILENGVPIGSRRMIKGFDKIVRSWNRYSTEFGDIYSPLGEEDIKRIARINPGYSPVEKLVLRNRAVISINPVETIAKAFITLIEAKNGKSQGWDYTSELPTRQQMAAIVEFIGKFRLELVRELIKHQKKEGGSS